MSIIVGVHKNDRIVLAADTMHFYGNRREHPDNVACGAKVRRVGRSHVGGVGWTVYDNILEHYLHTQKRPPALGSERAIFDFFLKFWKVMRDKYQFVNDQSGDNHDEPSPFADLDSEFIVANRNGLFQVGTNLTVMRFEKYLAIGSGQQYAYGALHALYATSRTAEQIARQATQAAAYFDQGCGGEVECFAVR